MPIIPATSYTTGVRMLPKAGSSSASMCPDTLWDSSSLQTNEKKKTVSLGLKRPECEVDHSVHLVLISKMRTAFAVLKIMALRSGSHIRTAHIIMEM
jgi:hypothetical protein